MFRFSLKWILAAMVYAAIAAAAFSQETWVYADILCAVSLLALGYAVMLIIYARGERQAAAAGFAVFMVLLAACLLMAPQSVPSLRILTAAGVGQTPSMPIAPAPVVAFPTPPSGTWSSSATASGGTLSVSANPNVAAYAAPTTSLRFSSSPVPVFYSAPFAASDITAKLRAFNAIATMIIGLLGCLLGVLAYRRARPEAVAIAGV
jgi:hypothetical protein